MGKPHPVHIQTDTVIWYNVTHISQAANSYWETSRLSLRSDCFGWRCTVFHWHLLCFQWSNVPILEFTDKIQLTRGGWASRTSVFNLTVRAVCFKSKVPVFSFKRLHQWVDFWLLSLYLELLMFRCCDRGYSEVSDSQWKRLCSYRNTYFLHI